MTAGGKRLNGQECLAALCRAQQGTPKTACQHPSFPHRRGDAPRPRRRAGARRHTHRNVGRAARAGTFCLVLRRYAPASGGSYPGDTGRRNRGAKSSGRPSARGLARAPAPCPACRGGSSGKAHPGTIRIDSNAQGRPEFRVGATGWHLSLSARGAVALIAIADAPCGVDLEIEEPDLMIPSNILRGDERAWLGEQPEPLRVAAFCRIWTAKEAITKALGVGFRIPPEDIALPAAERAMWISANSANRPWGKTRIVSCMICWS